MLLPQTALAAQCASLVQAWRYAPSDRLLNVLPLHHIHGVVNALLAPLYAGASVEFLAPFNATAVWERLASPFMPHRGLDDQRHRSPNNGYGGDVGDDASSSGSSGSSSSSSVATKPPPLLASEPITIFTAVPTMYSRLLSAFPALPPHVQRAARTAVAPRHLRLPMSGSAALPAPTRAAWAALSGGNGLLERYGMTEVGMALSSGIGLAERCADIDDGDGGGGGGGVGRPLPLVQVRLVDPDTGAVIATDDGDSDKRGDSVDGRRGTIGAGDAGDAGDAGGAGGAGRGDGGDSTRLGEIQLRGPTLFREYWGNAQATAEAFVPVPEEEEKWIGSSSSGGDGGRWFKTGDMAVRRMVSLCRDDGNQGVGGDGSGADRAAAGAGVTKLPMYFIQGRKDADIIKTGGEKVSALEVERELLSL